MEGSDRFVKVSAPETYAAGMREGFATAQKKREQQPKMALSDRRCALPVIVLQPCICDRVAGAPLVS